MGYPPNVDPDDMPHPYEYDERVPLPRPHDSGKPDPWADLDPRQKEAVQVPHDSTHKTKPQKCAEENCSATFIPHQWGAYEATRKGWFIQKDGTGWCPEHNPSWVVEWRARKAAEKN